MKLSAVIIFLVFMLSCQKNHPPELEIDDDTLVYILADLHMAESAVSSVPTAIRDSIENVLSLQIANIYKLDAIKMENYIKAFQKDIPRHREIYKRVVDTLESWGDNAVRLSLINREVSKDSLR